MYPSIQHRWSGKRDPPYLQRRVPVYEWPLSGAKSSSRTSEVLAVAAEMIGHMPTASFGKSGRSACLG